MPDQPTITSKNLPPQAAPATPTPTVPPAPASQIPYEQIVAKPLRSPNFINLKPKNPNMSLYWGNRAVGEKESAMRYDELIAKGFQPASPADVIDAPPSLVRDGRIMYGDLILLKMPRADYVGQQKWNEQSARQRVRRFGSAMDGNQQPVSAFSDITANPRLADKIRPYVPSTAAVDDSGKSALQKEVEEHGIS